MRTEYKRGKPSDLQVPAVRMKTMWHHTLLNYFLFFPPLAKNPTRFCTTKALLKVTNCIMHVAVMFSNNRLYLYAGSELPRHDKRARSNFQKECVQARRVCDDTKGADASPRLMTTPTARFWLRPPRTCFLSPSKRVEDPSVLAG